MIVSGQNEGKITCIHENFFFFFSIDFYLFCNWYIILWIKNCLSLDMIYFEVAKLKKDSTYLFCLQCISSTGFLQTVEYLIINFIWKISTLSPPPPSLNKSFTY